MAKSDTIKLTVFIIFRVLLAVSLVIALTRGSWINVLTSSLTVALTFLPSIIERKFKVDYPNEFEIIIVSFIFASVYLGDIHNFYLRFWWWDIMLHSFSGIVIGAIGFSLIYILNRAERVAVKLNRGFVAIFAFCFSLAIGTLWEIYEFLMDRYFGMQMQRFGLNDTMWDLMLDVGGALVVAVAGYLYLNGEAGFLKSIVKKFTVLNPKLFKKVKA